VIKALTMHADVNNVQALVPNALCWSNRARRRERS